MRQVRGGAGSKGLEVLVLRIGEGLIFGVLFVGVEWLQYSRGDRIRLTL